MQIVIELSEEDYNSIDGCICVYGDAIKNGIVLPKGHGRLIDADELIKDRVENDNTVILVSNAKTVIPADKENA